MLQYCIEGQCVFAACLASRTLQKCMAMPDERAPESQRQAIRDWMIAVKERTGWSNRAWARLAKTSPSNISRMLKDEHASMPTWGTMSKLAKVAPIQAPELQPWQAVDERSRWLGFYEAVPASRRTNLIATVSEIVRLVADDQTEPPHDLDKKPIKKAQTGAGTANRHSKRGG